ncbi:MAG: glycosyltransferase [Bacteroidales bacterium]|nr:glycosyltransferase [Bacteroidales bacterium]
MIWLASFPRSGNTFVRNILFEVYGIESSTFHYQVDYTIDHDYDKFVFVKTHELPDLLVPADKSIPAVYIVRDGRDAMVSMAHHRKDIIVPGSDFYQNLKEAIIADKGSFFGGWSENVSQWIKRADIVIRYEDLLADPIACVERIRHLHNLPEPDRDKLPTFEKLKFGIPKYGAKRDINISESEKRDQANRFFRKGKKGTWKEEMPDELHDLFWSYHGETMIKLGYSFEGEMNSPDPDFDYNISSKLGITKPKKAQRNYKVLIESNKLVSTDNDGVKRYQVELLKGLLPLAENENSGWQIDLFIHGEIHPLADLKANILSDFNMPASSDDPDSARKRTLFETLEKLLVSIVPRGFVSFLDRHNITIFHRAYEFIKRILFFSGSLLLQLKNLLRGRSASDTQENTKADMVQRFNEYDLIHLPLKHHYTPFVNAETHFISTIHDLTHLYFPQFHTKINISNSEKGMRFLLDKNAHLIAVSESTKNDLLKDYDITDDKIHTIHEAADKRKFNFKINQDDADRVKTKYGIDIGTPYFICLSTIEPRKNLTNTLRAFLKLVRENPEIRLKLVIAGKKGWHTNKLQLEEDWIANRVIFTGFVDDRDIPFLYSNAVAMSYISFYEGFGLPLLEAMSCGTPVLFGNNSSMIEVVGDGGLPCDPNEINDIKNKMHQMYYDAQLRKTLSIKALKQSNKFSWRKSVMETLDVYMKVIDNQSIPK